ncbi:MAG TPA: redoxin domain-containing protein [Pyrinomonadaceae bacterium]|jgi:thiol-disulfide isomerase/thioredoxin|nr:redoxin domain-containing protein [Pyrinomonadaceae bacterium]
MTRVSKVKPARLLIGCVVIAAGILLLTFSAAAQGKTVRKARGAAAAKSPTVPAINTEEMQQLLKRDGKRPLLVNFWATWCIPCRVEFPDLIKIDKDYRKRGLEFIAISLDDAAERETTVPKFLRELKAQMPVYLLNVPDPDPAINSVDPEWGGVLPATFLYNNKGEVVYKHFGPIKPTELRSAIERLVGSKQ